MKTRFRLIKPGWGKPLLRNDKKNPEFVTEIKGRDVFEGYFSEKFLSIRNKEGYNIYYFPNHPSKIIRDKKFISGKDVDQFNCVFLDMDLKDKVYESKSDFLKVLKKFPLKPTRTVDSGHGIHAYWYVDPLERNEYIITQLLLVQHFKTDSSLFTTLQLMRDHRFLNTKVYNKFRRTKLITKLSSKKMYELSELWESLPRPNTQSEQKYIEHVDRLEGRIELDLDKNDISDDLPEKFLQLMDKEDFIKGLFEDPKGIYGDRSGGDMSLCNHLFSADFDAKESLAVMFNTLKAKSRDASNRFSYAHSIVEKVYADRITDAVPSLQEYKYSPKREDIGTSVNGPDYFDCLQTKWRRGQVLGLVGGTGVGKTEITLQIFRDFLLNNPHNDDLLFFVSLEMSTEEILERWEVSVGSRKEHLDRLHVIENSDPNKRVGYQELIKKVQDTCKKRGRKPLAVAVDHLKILGDQIDSWEKPTFGLKDDGAFGYGRIKTLTPEKKCTLMPVVAKHLNTFLIVQNQTTKARMEQGDIPLGVEAAYGTAMFEWHSDYMLTIWQPLRRVESKTAIRALAWQYTKIRKRGKEDGTQLLKPHALAYDMTTGRFSRMGAEEFIEYKEWAREALAIRKLEREKKQVEYYNSPVKLIPKVFRALTKESRLDDKKVSLHKYKRKVKKVRSFRQKKKTFR